MNQLPVKKEVSVKTEPSDSIDQPSTIGSAVNSRPGSSTGSKSTPNGVNAKDQEWQDIPLKCCTKEELEDTRYHMLRFQTKQDVDIINNFTKPVRLHRKDPRNIQFQLTREEIDRRKRDQDQRKEERDKAREEAAAAKAAAEAEEARLAQEDPKYKSNQADMSQVAPDGGARKPKKNIFKRKTKQINLMNEDKRKLRYEEYYPWVLEDYTGKNVFVGNYEAGSSDTQHVLFVFDKDGFKMVPAEKVYKFTPRNKYATLTLEEAEAKMEKNATTPRWLMKHMQDNSSVEGASPDMRFRHTNDTANPGAAPATFGGSNSLGGGSGGGRSRRLKTVMGGSTGNDRDSDHDDIDFDEEFADDEEAPIMDGDEEENKLSEKKIKREMLKAAHFDGQSDAEIDDDDDLNDLFETEKTRKVDKEGKKLRKVLNKTEGGVYDSDDDNEQDHPYVSQSDLESANESDDEQIKVKMENNDDALLNEENQPNVRLFSATYNGNGFVSVKAPKEFLSGFPHGEWNPHSHKRQITADLSPNKKVKIEQPSSPKLKLAFKKDRASLSPSPSPTPTSTNFTPGATPSNPSLAISDLNSPGKNNELVTVGEVLGIVKNNPLTTKELLFHLKNRISSHKDNKLRIISIVKQTLKLVDGKLVLKDS